MKTRGGSMKLPAKFMEKMRRLLDEEEYEQLISALSGERVCGLRVNTLKIGIDEFQKISPFDLEAVPWTDDGFYISGEDAPGRHPYYHAGLYYIQEPSAMLPGQVLGAEPGDRVLDMCAAPGGKTVQIAAAMKGRGLLVSNDINAERVKALVKNIELCGIRNAIVLNESPENLARNFKGYFDKILIDAPCSGEGMFRKDETAVRSWESFKCERCSKMQEAILHYADLLLKPGGTLVYSTCTFSPEENEQMIIDFILKHKGYELVEIPKLAGIEGGRPEWAGIAGKQACTPEHQVIGENPEWAQVIGEGPCDRDTAVGKLEQLTDDSSFHCVDYGVLECAARLWPHKVRGEGHFVAKLVKRGTSPVHFSGSLCVPGDSHISGNMHYPDRNVITGHNFTGETISSFTDKTVYNFKGETASNLIGGSVPNDQVRTAYGYADRFRETVHDTRNAINDIRGQGGETSTNFIDSVEETIPYEKLPEVFHRFVDENMNWFPDGVFLLKGRHLYHLPEPPPLLSGLKVVKFGWFLGTVEDNRFEPSHSLVMALDKGAFKRTLDLGTESAEVRSYLKGETLILKGDKGLTAVCVDGKTLGWAKQTGDMLKNMYPKGWRMMK
ncbi:MAG TPA: RsmB/NOP family class I SAM-dependent RNA methyltransferase [Clostridia bacterium]